MIRSTTTAEFRATGQSPAAAAPEGGAEFAFRADWLAAGSPVPQLRQLVERLFAVPDVDRIEVDRRRSSIRLELTCRQGRVATLRRLADALREADDRPIHETRHLALLTLDNRPLRITRYDGILSSWEILHALPGRLRLRHDSLPGEVSARRYIERELAALAGVRDVSVGHRTGTVLVQYDEQALEVVDLLRTLEGLLRDLLDPAESAYRHADVDLAAPTGALALAVTADLLVPVLMPASAVVLVATNVRHLKTAAGELARLRPGLSTLYTTIVGGTLVSGLFFPAALMAWFVRFWDRHYHRRLSQAQQDVLRPFQRRARYAWLSQADGSEREVPVDQIQAGDILTVAAGDLVPADGVVVEGQAMIDQRHLRPGAGSIPRGPGDDVLAGTLVHQGGLRIEVRDVGAATHCGALSRILQRATTPPVETLIQRGQPFAERTVPTTLAMAGLGLAVGDLGTSLAVLRPDYATGPGMARPMGVLQDLYAALQAGIVVRDPQVFTLLPEIDVLVVQGPAANSDEHPPTLLGSAASDARWQALAVELAALRRRTGLRIGLVADTPDEAVKLWGQRLGLDFAAGDMSDERTRELMRGWQSDGRRVAFVGDCQLHADSARQADLAIGLGPVVAADDSPAHVYLLDGGPARLELLWSLARVRRNRGQLQLACALVPNLCCVLGAFALGFTSLHAVLLTNLGVYAAYQVGTRWLRPASRLPGT